jgi:hypothetical protein
VLIWIIMAVVLVVIVAGGYGGNRYRKRGGSGPNSTGRKTHHGKAARNHRGRGHGH